MKKIPKKIIREIIDLFVNSGKTESCDYEYKEGVSIIKHETVVYKNPKLLWRGSFCYDYSSKALLFFYGLEENYSEYANVKKNRDDYNEKILKLYIEYFGTFSILDPYIPMTDELANRLIEDSPYRIYELKNPTPELRKKAFDLSNDLVLNDSFDENALFPTELKIEVLRRHPGYVDEISPDTEPYLEAETYKMDYKTELKNVDKLCKNITIIRGMETEDDKSGMSFLYNRLIKKSDDVNDVYTKSEVYKICDEEQESRDLPIIELLTSLNDEDYLDLMRYLKSRYIRMQS